MSGARKWDDLAVRLASGLALVVVGLAAIWAGGLWFRGALALICGAMIWELVTMMRPEGRNAPIILGLVAAGAILSAAYLPPGIALPLLLAPGILGMALLSRFRALYLSFGVAVLLAGFGMLGLRDDLGFVWLLWLVGVVVVTDVAGYFAGRAFGGPKFWPSVSPKKTWSGTAAGWIGAAVLGLIFSATMGVSWGLAGISIAVSMASQMGDIAESAMKRQMGVKDSSALIPGHGGLLDRFDGMLGAALFMLVVLTVVPFPPVAG